MNLTVILGCISSLLISTVTMAGVGSMPKPGQVRVTISDGTKILLLPFEKVIQVDKEGAWTVDINSPDGEYSVEWTREVPAAGAFKIVGEVFKANANQSNSLLVSLDGGRSWDGISNDKDWTWQKKETLFFDAVNYSQAAKQNAAASKMTLMIAWRFAKPHKDAIWQTGIRNISITSADAKTALNEFQKPLGQGLPNVALPPENGITDKPKWEVKNETLLRDGKPFFPIGFVMFDTGDKHLGQALAMGANAVHFEAGWAMLMKNPGDIADPQAADTIKARIHRVGQWGMTTFPMMTGHYIPDWFVQANATQKAFPLGSDGKPTGGWFAYSIHYPPFRQAISKFWKNIAPLYAGEPSVVASILWNEPAYGGIWCSPSQFGDYSSWSIDNFQIWLKVKYTSLDDLNRQWHTNYSDWKKIQPPRTPDQMSRKAWIDWMHFGQQTFADFFQWERSVIHDAAPDLWLTNKKQTNPLDNSAASSGTNWYLMSKSEDLFGLDAYEGPSYETTMNLARSMSDGKPVIVFETNVMPPTAVVRTPARIRKQLWSQIVGGVRGMFIFCLDKVPEHGILEDSSVSPQSRPEYTRFMQTVNKFGPILALPNEPAPVGVIYSTTSTLQYPNSPKWPGAFHAAYSLIRNSQYNVDVIPEEKCDLKILSHYKVIVIPSYTILPEKCLKALDEFVTGGGKILAFGHCLEQNENFIRYSDSPACLGLKTRDKPLGDREQLRLIVQDSALLEYVSDEIEINGAEKVTTFKEQVGQMVMGKNLTVNEKIEKVLALNNDSYPSMITTRNGGVVYCAFEAQNSELMRRLMEGVMRDLFKVPQTIRFVADGKVAYAPVSIRQIRDPNSSKTYILLLNTGGEEKTLSIQTNLILLKELFHSEKTLTDKKLQVKPFEVYLIETEKK
jgi:beta-galactosidase